MLDFLKIDEKLKNIITDSEFNLLFKITFNGSISMVNILSKVSKKKKNFMTIKLNKQTRW